MCKSLMTLHILELINTSLKEIRKRSEKINHADDFLMSESGVILLDSICMKLSAVGESIKNLDKITEHQLLPRWKIYKRNECNIWKCPSDKNNNSLVPNCLTQLGTFVLSIAFRLSFLEMSVTLHQRMNDMRAKYLCLVAMTIALAACWGVFYGTSFHKLVFVCIYSLIISVNS